LSGIFPKKKDSRRASLAGMTSERSSLFVSSSLACPILWKPAMYNALLSLLCKFFATLRFRLSDLERVCPGVSRDMIRGVLRDRQGIKEVECLGRGPGAFWRKRVIPLKKGNKKGNIAK
ncbi:MAG: hypothetical protein M1497_00040, partial [Nitrospirae bacterium]|nr:hypothetical protein [Nitrospirota bacterium]